MNFPLAGPSDRCHFFTAGKQLVFSHFPSDFSFWLSEWCWKLKDFQSPLSSKNSFWFNLQLWQKVLLHPSALLRWASPQGRTCILTSVLKPVEHTNWRWKQHTKIKKTWTDLHVHEAMCLELVPWSYVIITRIVKNVWSTLTTNTLRNFNWSLIQSIQKLQLFQFLTRSYYEKWFKIFLSNLRGNF